MIEQSCKPLLTRELFFLELIMIYVTEKWTTKGREKNRFAAKLTQWKILTMLLTSESKFMFGILVVQ